MALLVGGALAATGALALDATAASSVGGDLTVQGGGGGGNSSTDAHIIHAGAGGGGYVEYRVGGSVVYRNFGGGGNTSGDRGAGSISGGGGGYPGVTGQAGGPSGTSAGGDRGGPTGNNSWGGPGKGNGFISDADPTITTSPPSLGVPASLSGSLPTAWGANPVSVQRGANNNLSQGGAGGSATFTSDARVDLNKLELISGGSTDGAVEVNTGGGGSAIFNASELSVPEIIMSGPRRTTNGFNIGTLHVAQGNSILLRFGSSDDGVSVDNMKFNLTSAVTNGATMFNVVDGSPSYPIRLFPLNSVGNITLAGDMSGLSIGDRITLITHVTGTIPAIVIEGDLVFKVEVDDGALVATVVNMNIGPRLHTFETVSIGYDPSEVTTAEFAISNNSGYSMTSTFITLVNGASSSFEIVSGGAPGGITISSGSGNYSIEARPLDGQGVGTHTDTLRIRWTDDGGVQMNVNIPLSFTVSALSYDIHMESAAGGTATASHTRAPAETMVSLTAVPNEGYEFVWWVVLCSDDGSDISGNLVPNEWSPNATFPMPSSDVTITPEFKLKDGPGPWNQYGVLSHFGTWAGSGTVAARIDAPFGEFKEFFLDGVPVDKEHYEVTEGSTIITLAESYLRTLPDDVHAFHAEFEAGYANLPLTVARTGGAANPATGDYGNPMLFWQMVLMLAALGTSGVIFLQRQRLAGAGMWVTYR